MGWKGWSLPLLLIAGLAQAQEAPRELTVELNLVDDRGTGQAIGTVTVQPSDLGGILLTPDLRDLPPGLHGFHVHEKPSCQPAREEGEATAAAAAGGHYDPEETGRHEGPYGDGHLGDLPALFVDEAGRATHPVHAPRLELSDLEGRALVVHAGGDNYADEPEPLGGGGERIACGVIKAG